MSTRTSTQALQPLIAAARATWQKRTPRERQWLRLAALVMLLALTWRLALEPALTTWREAPSRQAALDQKTSQMRQLQAQAKALQKPTAITRAEALRWLEANIPANLGSDASWRMQGERLNVSLKSASSQQLAHWLVQARERAQATPEQAQLQQTPAPSADASPQDVRWSGTLVMRLP